MRIKLKAKCQLQGRIYQNGDVVDWPDSVPLPFCCAIDASYSIGTNVPADEVRARCDKALYDVVADEN